MKVVALSCPQCGGTQDVAQDQSLVECRYCRTVLRVERNADGELERLLIENQRLELENALHRLEKEWAARRQNLLITTNRGVREPSSAWASVCLLGGACFVVTGLISLLIARIPEQISFVLIACGVILVVAGVREFAAGVRFEKESNAYKGRRLVLEKQLAEVKRATINDPSYEDTKSRRLRLDRISYPAADA